jgi:hypothetical protein
MEDVLAVYARPPQKDIPLVCLDEFAKQLLSETRQPVAAIPGHLARADYEYVRDEIGLLSRTCLDRRIGSVGEFETEVTTYLEWKNKNSKPINWQFTNENARIKLKSLYPAI